MKFLISKYRFSHRTIKKNFKISQLPDPLNGFSLLETILSMAIIAIFISGLATLDRLYSDSQSILSLSSQSFNEANIGIDAMIREIRAATHADTGSYPLELAHDQEIIFYSNMDDDPGIERVRYYLTGNELNRGIIDPQGEPPTYPLANERVNLVISYIQNQSNPIFYYYNGDWPNDTVNNPLATPASLTDTKLIRVMLTINPKPSRPESQYSIESFAQIRSLKNNL